MKYFIVLALLAVAAADKLSGNEPIPIVHQDSHVDPDGSFRSSFETGNGIISETSGVLKNPGKENEASSVTGKIHYTAPDGQSVDISFVADENGYQPQGSHIPVAPEVPPAIAKAVKYLLSLPPQKP